MNYGKIKTYSRVSPKPKHHIKSKIVAGAALVFLIAVAQVSAAGNAPATPPAVVRHPVTALTVKQSKAVKPADNSSDDKSTIAESTTPAPAADPSPAPVVDPNNCEAQGMHYRADNNECIVPPPAAPAPAPSPTPAPAPAYAGGTSCDLARSLIAQYPWNQQSAYDVMVQESGCNTGSANTKDGHYDSNGALICTGSYGLFQISCENGVIYDPAANVAQAFAMWQARGWQPWSFTTCKIVACI